tara:strand:- start:9613 stop:10518 length:906 start_codon:yes stop_codon:yes gene_type:complete
MKLNLNLIKEFNNSIKTDVKLSNYSWFNLGGPAEYFFKPENKAELVNFLKENKKYKLKTTILGAGSNTLVRDNGVKGVVIKLGTSFSKIELINESTIQVGAAALDRKISNFAKENGIGNFEFLSCIPGSIGGAVIMNSGCYGNDISKVLVSINGIDPDNFEEKEIQSKDIKFFYRGTNISKKFIIISAKLKGKADAEENIEEKQKKFIEQKKLSQPSQIKTCGSTFKNIINEKKAWQLIKETGCDKFRVGDAVISEKHCNFFVNIGKAKSSDIEKLINKVKKTVFEKTGVNLELEIKIIGE